MCDYFIIFLFYALSEADIVTKSCASTAVETKFCWKGLLWTPIIRQNCPHELFANVVRVGLYAHNISVRL
jgi:hypothetical protein